MALLVLIVETGSRRVVAGRGDVLAVGQGLGAVMDIGVRLGCLAVFVRQVRIAGKNHITGGHGRKGGIFIHEDGNIAIFRNAGGQILRAVAVVISFIAGLDGNGAPQLAADHLIALVVVRGIGSILGVGGEAEACRFQLGHVHRIRIQGTSRHTGDLAGQEAAFRVVADGNGVGIGNPGRRSLCGGISSQHIVPLGTAGTVGQSPAAQSHAVCQFGLGPISDGGGIGGRRCDCASQCGQGVLGGSDGANTKGRGGFAGSNAVFAPDGGIGIAQDMIAIGPGGGLFQVHARKRLIPYGHRAIVANDSTADIAPIVADIGIAVFSLEQHVAVGFPAGNGVGDGFCTTIVVRIGQVAAGVHLFTRNLDGIAICIFDNTTIIRICPIDNIGIGTVFVQHSAGYVIGAKSGRIHAGCYGAVAESGGIFT